MSIVAVHGPNTFGSMGVIGSATGTATADPANGMHWVFRADPSRYTSTTAADYDWAYTPTTGTPASGATTLNLGPTLDVTFSGADGNRTVTLTYQNVAQTPTMVVPAAAGAAPSLRMAPVEGGGGEEPVGELEQQSSLQVGFDPAAHTVDEVKAYADEHPEEIEELLEAEQAGKNRTTLVNYLEDLVPFDPANYSVAEVVEYAEGNPELVNDIIEAEQAGKNRSTLISQLGAMRTA